MYFVRFPEHTSIFPLCCINWFFFVMCKECVCRDVGGGMCVYFCGRLPKMAKIDCYVCLSAYQPACLSVHTEQLDSNWTVFHEIWYFEYFCTFFFVFLLTQQPPPQWAMAPSFTRFLDHTQRRTTVGRIPLDEWSVRRRPDNTQHSQQTNVHAPGGIRTHNPSRLGAADLRLWPHGHWDRLFLYNILTRFKFQYTLTRIPCTLRENLRTVICLRIVLIMKNVPFKCVQKI